MFQMWFLDNIIHYLADILKIFKHFNNVIKMFFPSKCLGNILEML